MTESAITESSAVAQGTSQVADRAAQSEVLPSARACIDALQLLNEGLPMLSRTAGGINPDLSVYLFKQPNEGYAVDGNGSGADAATAVDSMTIGAMRPGLYGQRDNVLGQRAVDEVGEDLVGRPAYFSAMREVFGQSRYFDLVRNHNQVISTPGGRTMAELADDAPTVLLNFDAHSDMYTESTMPGEESIAQWVNSVLQNNPGVNEVYWVLPQDFSDNAQIRSIYLDHQGPAPVQDPVFVYAPRDMTLYLNNSTGALQMTKPDNFSEEAYRTVSFHKRTMQELPDFKGKRAAVSIDLDYFDNRGYDTSYEASVSYRSEEGFASFVEGLRSANLRPVFTTVSASPEYVRPEHMRDLLRFSSLVAEASNAPTDAVVVPQQNVVYPLPGRDRQDGLQVNRSSNQSLELLYEMFRIDSQTARPNDSINLNGDSAEVRATVAATKRVYGLQTDAQAREVLERFDRADGVANGVLEFEAIESLLVRLCRTTPEAPLRKDPLRPN